VADRIVASRGAPLHEVESVYRTHYADFVRFAAAVCGDREAARVY
jgi:hypothetical protein